MDYFRHALFFLFLSSVICLNAQNPLQQPIPLEKGDYKLFDALQEIKESGIPFAFSTTRLHNVSITVGRKETVKSFLDRLKKEKVIRYDITNSQILITRYVSSKFTLNGLIKDAETGEHLIGASIQIDESDVGAVSNGYGYYSLTLEEGDYDIMVSHIGYKTVKTDIELSKNTFLSISAKPRIFQLEEVEVSSISGDINISSTIPSISRLSIGDESGQIPYFLGEVDVIQNALLQPGIKTVGEDASGIHIRGGGADQNLILLDEATIYNPNHFYGLISVFNPEAINDVRILRGFIPPSYGGRASSVIEVRQKEGNTNRLSYSGGIGVLSARGLIEGPIKKGTSSFLASARQSLLNLSIDDFASTSVRRNRIRFQDINLKINSRPNERNTYYLSGYFGNDRNTAGFNSIRNWGNRMVNFRWNHIFAPKLFSNFSAFVSEYIYRIESSDEEFAFVSKSRIVDYSVKADLSYVFNPNNELNFGFSSIFHRLKPGDREPIDIDAANKTNTIRLDPEHGLESAFYISQQTKAGPVSFNYGLRYSAFHNFGPEDVRIYAPDGPISDSTVIDTLFFGKNELIKLHQNLEPRIAVNWQLNSSTSIKAAYSKTAQYLHLISNTLAPAPTDIWKLSDTYIPPSVTHQYTLGFYKNFREDKWETNFEVYYKDNLKDFAYRNGADLIFNENIETELLIGRGRSYGLELYISKKYGKFTGWLSYTLSRSETRLEEDNQSAYVLNNFDKTHDLSTTVVTKISDRLSISGNFLFATGIPLTLPSDKYVFENNLVPHFADRNASRLPNYHRLDLSLKWEGRRLKKDGSERKNRDFWIFTIYNAYARQNVNSYFFRQSETNPGLGEVVQYSIFGTIIPALTYNFKF
ncbi:MAG: TonB-dependent receptor [Cyclobacteriaceae bacterium]